MEIETIEVKLPDKKNSSQKILVELTVKEDSDPQLEFLKQKASNYPRLFILAMKYLWLMASRTPLERFFFYKKKEELNLITKQYFLPKLNKMLTCLVLERGVETA